MHIRSCPHELESFRSYELLSQDSLTLRPSNTPPKRTAKAADRTSHQEDVRDYRITLITTIALGSVSFLCLASAIAKFGQALTMMPQTQVEVPQHLTHQALSQLK